MDPLTGFWRSGLGDGDASHTTDGGGGDGNCAPQTSRTLRLRVPALRLAEANIHGPGSLIPSFHFEIDVLSFPQTLEVETLEARAVKENLLAVCGANEAEAAVANYPFDCSLHIHLDWREERGLYILL
jgi:hypothetical protein